MIERNYMYWCCVGVEYLHWHVWDTRHVFDLKCVGAI